MKDNKILVFLTLLSIIISCSDNKTQEVKYQNLVWQYKTQDQFDFDILIKDSVFYLQSYKEDTLTKQLIKTDSIRSKVIYWDNGYLIIENNNKKINDTILYETDNSTGVNGLFLKITKYDYWL